MQRICTSLANVGYDVLLIGRKLKNSLPLKNEVYNQKRLTCFFNKKIFFYAEYNIRLFFFLLFVRMDLICAVDLDTILPCYFISACKRKRRMYDAHELFTETKEVITRPVVKKTWMQIEKFAVPKFKNGYTVNFSIAEELKKRYQVNYSIIRNVPYKKTYNQTSSAEKVFLYQGAFNEARGLENLVLAMKQVGTKLLMCGDGIIFNAIQNLVKENNLEDKIYLKGKVLPAELDNITIGCYAGINLFEPVGLNHLYSLANKFFDYMQAGIPQLTMNFPEYKKINDEYEVAVLINTVAVNEIAAALNLLLNDAVLYERLKKNCHTAKEVFTWQNEEEQLLEFYKNLFDS